MIKQYKYCLIKAREDIYPHFARIGQALGHPKRVQILVYLLQRPRTGESLAEELGESAASTSALLKVLREAHLVVRRKDGRRVFYAPASDHVARLLGAVRAAAEAEVPAVREALSADRADEPALVDRSFRALLDEIEAGRVLTLDVRVPEEHAAGHVPGARSIPFAELPAALPDLPRDTPIVVYCRGPYCPVARAAVRLLRDEGFEAVGLRAGLGEWRAEGMPVASG